MLLHKHAITFCGYMLLLVVIAITTKGYCMDNDQNKNLIHIQVSPVQETVAVDCIPVRITFSNTGSNDVKILRLFDPLPVFFSLTLTMEDGTPVAQAGGGKIDFRGEDKYITIRPKESYSTVIDIAPWLKTNTKIGEGVYSLKMTYHNQYGENCFKGSIDAIPVKLIISPPCG